VGSWPQDGRTWLFLGNVLGLEGREQARNICYQQGLRHWKGVDLRNAPEFLFDALAQALLVLPDHNLEREWLTVLPGDQKEGYGWAMLSSRMGTTEPARYERLVRSALKVPGHGHDATVALVGWLIDHHKEDEGMAVCEEGMRRFPESTELPFAWRHFNAILDFRKNAARIPAVTPSRQN
jgi:hypothetical protein